MAIWTDEELEFRRRRYRQLHDEWVVAGMAEVAESNGRTRLESMPVARAPHFASWFWSIGSMVGH